MMTGARDMMEESRAPSIVARVSMTGARDMMEGFRAPFIVARVSVTVARDIMVAARAPSIITRAPIIPPSYPSLFYAGGWALPPDFSPPYSYRLNEDIIKRCAF